MQLSEIDRNFEIKTSLDADNIKFYDIKDEPFSLYGVFYENGMYRRIPETVAIKAVMTDVGKMPHFALTGSAGFDLYIGKKEEYCHTFVPDFGMTDGYEGIAYFDNAEQREITVNFPLYSSVAELYIGIDADAELKKSSGYKHKKPVVFYGSSITQGGCASRPGNSYESIVSRELQSDYINLGFSGSAKAEDAIAEYISTLDMSVFVYDYDHNAPSTEHLKNTHRKMFAAIRSKNPDLPIIMLSRPKFKLTSEETERLEIIRKTYADAVSSGDKNVFIIDGTVLMQYAKNDGTVDGCHPNDLGFYSMAKTLIPELRPLLKE